MEKEVLRYESPDLETVQVELGIVINVSGCVNYTENPGLGDGD